MSVSRPAAVPICYVHIHGLRGTLDWVCTGLPVFEDGDRRMFEDFCSHWKENHRILVQVRCGMLDLRDFRGAHHTEDVVTL